MALAGAGTAAAVPTDAGIAIGGENGEVSPVARLVAVATTNWPTRDGRRVDGEGGVAGRVSRHRRRADQGFALAVAPGVGAALGAAEKLDAELRVRRAARAAGDLRPGLAEPAASDALMIG